MKLISWNIAQRVDAWRALLDSGADVALLQEACKPPADVASQVAPAPWRTGRNQPWRAVIGKLSDRVDIKWLTTTSLSEVGNEELGVSRPGSLAAATVTTPSGEAFFVVSAYGLWERPHDTARSGWIYADASVHRIISDLSALLGHESKHKLIVAGDLNVLYGYGERGNAYWASRYATVFD